MAEMNHSLNTKIVLYWLGTQMCVCVYNNNNNNNNKSKPYSSFPIVYACLLAGLPGVSVGQNLYWNSASFDPVDGVLAWESEKAQFVYEGSNDGHAVGHYTEVKKTNKQFENQ